MQRLFKGIRIFLNKTLFMKKSIKAALLSAFLCPGAGHIYLKKYLFGSILILVAFTTLFVITSKAVEKASVISEQIAKGEIPYDMEVIRDLISKSQSPEEIQQINTMTLIFIFAWFVGIFDSYRVARSQETSGSLEA